MKRCMGLHAFVRDASGATMIEYALIAGGISLVMITALTTTAADLTATFTKIAEAIAGGG